MRKILLTVVALLTLCVPAPAQAKQDTCKGHVDYAGGLYEKRIGGGYFEYIQPIRNNSQHTYRWMMAVTSMRVPTEAMNGGTVHGQLKPGETAKVVFARGSGNAYWLEHLRKIYEPEDPRSFPALKLHGCEQRTPSGGPLPVRLGH